MIEIIRKGSQICIVDSGRYNFRRYGVPTSGAMDGRSSTRANSLLHNNLQDAVLEMYMPGHHLIFHDSTKIALSGAEAEIYLDNKRIYSDQSFLVNKGTVLTVGAMSRGSRLYLAVQGGIQSSVVLRSRSSIPGYLDRSLNRGDKVSFNPATISSKLTASISALKIENSKKISCLRGPEWHLLQEEVQAALLNEIYIIDQRSDRMGYRLEGVHVSSEIQSIYSSSVMPGTVQFLPNGLPLILMRDCQTTGGYPRIFQITEEDINQLGQRKPGDEVRFELIQAY